MGLKPSAVTVPAMPSAGTGIAEIHMLDARHGWALTGGPTGGRRLLFTGDGGLGWRDRTPHGNAEVGTVEDRYNGVYFLDSRHGWVSVSNRGAAGLWRTSNGGKTWTCFETTKLFREFHFQDARHGVARTLDGGLGNAYVRFFGTSDGGRNWEPVLIASPAPAEPGLPPGTIHLCNLCADRVNYYPPATVIITHGDLGDEQPKDAVRLSVSTDLGKTWQNLSLPLPSEKFGAGLVEGDSPVFFDGLNGCFADSCIRRKGRSFAGALRVGFLHDP